jgi:hypothetical protein
VNGGKPSGENKGDKLILQQKIVDLRLRYRNQFRELLGERRGNPGFQSTG